MVRVGQTVQVRVQEVDIARKRIALTMRLSDDTPPVGLRGPGAPDSKKGSAPRRAAAAAPPANNAMAEAFAKLRR